MADHESERLKTKDWSVWQGREDCTWRLLLGSWFAAS